MKVAIITDQHFGCRKNSKLFHDYFLKFYEDVFFPVLYSEGIDTVIDMGDTFDSRKGRYTQMKLIILLLTVMVFTGCSKVNYDVNPWTTVLNHMIKHDR